MRATTAIDQHLAALAGAGVSRSLLRQRRWALTGAATAAALGALHGPAPTVDQVAATDPAALDAARAALPLGAILAADFTTWYLPWAATGPLAHRAGAGTSAAAARARASALRALAADHHTPPPAHTHTGPSLRPVLPPRAIADLLTSLTTTGQPTPATVRLAALLAVTAAAPARAGQLCAMTLGDLDTADPDRLVLARPPDGPGPVTLTGPRARAVTAWLAVRAQLVGALGGTPPDALWVAVRPHMTPQRVVRPAGLPLHPRGLERAYTAAVRRLNGHLADHPELIGPHLHPATGGPVRLPASFELLRRSLDRTSEPAASD